MGRLQFSIANLMGVVAAAAVIVGVAAVDPMLGLALFVAAGVASAGWLLRRDLAVVLDRTLSFLGRPSGRATLVVLTLWIITAPAVLFYDPATYAPKRRGHIERNPTEHYVLFSDDVAYVAASRTLDRTLANLTVPHNTHLVPAWRLTTWALVAAAGNLHDLPAVLATAAYCVLVAVMLLAGAIVARETRRLGAGLAASALVGTTSLMLTPASWYSGGQPLWAVFGILAALWHAQSFRRSGRWLHMAFAAMAAAIAGGFWSAGHLAGPVTAVYLWIDGRRRCRTAALVPVAATAAAVALMFATASRPMDSTVSFHGRTIRQAMNPVQGAITTAQAIPENLLFANLGLGAETTAIQGILLTAGLLAFWLGRRWRRHPDGLDPAGKPGHPIPWLSFAFNPLECAGLAIVVGCYLLEWTFRGYFEYHNLRTISTYAIVPWYDVIPHVGAVLFVVGWWSGPRPAGQGGGHIPGPPARPTRGVALGLVILTLSLIGLNRPRVDAMVRNTCPRMLPSEFEQFKIPRLQTMRADLLIEYRVKWQRSYLRRLDSVEPVARRLGIGRDGIRAAFGHIYIPASTGRLLMAQRELYDVAAILDLPEKGRPLAPQAIRAALGSYLDADPEPRPQWIARGERWPPD